MPAETNDQGLLMLVIAAACMARGLLPEQADMVLTQLGNERLPGSPAEAMHNLDLAISAVRSMPTPH